MRLLSLLGKRTGWLVLALGLAARLGVAQPTPPAFGLVKAGAPLGKFSLHHSTQFDNRGGPAERARAV